MGEITLGLDIGVGSVGWALINQEQNHLIDMGVRIFNQATPAQESRLARGARRNQRRRKWRERQLLDAFCDFHIVSKEEISQPDYLSYTVNSDTFHRPKDDTVYHLRKRALSEEVSTRELILCLYNICKTRGHFLMETVNFEKDSITLPLFVEKFHELIDSYVDFDDQQGFDGTVLKKLFEQRKIGQSEIKHYITDGNYGKTERDDSALKEVCNLLSEYKAKLQVLDENLDLEKTVNINDLLKRDDLSDLEQGLIELHDLIRIAQTLKSHNYLCEIAVEKLDKMKDIYALETSDPKEYKKVKDDIQGQMNLSDKKKKQGCKSLKVVKNLTNNYPNGLYVKEARAILQQQQKYNPKITNSFIDICLDIIKARIPYYVGPLSEDGKNAWIKKTGKFKYSYQYSEKQAVDLEDTITAWKQRMISRCTYLPDEYALPKGSLLAEVFSIANEMNNLMASDKNGDTYYLTQKDKVVLFDKLFLVKKQVTFKDVCGALDLDAFGTNMPSNIKRFNNSITLYQSIVKLIPKLKLDSVMEIFENSSKIDEIEQIILYINLYDEELTKREYFEKLYENKDLASKLARLQSKGFYSFSKQFIFKEVMDVNGNTLLEKLFSDNKKDVKNEQMTIITNATDINGKPRNFLSNKYIKKLQKDNRLGIDLLMEDGKPVIPVARPVIRSLNECLKVYSGILDIYGVPDRVVIETAKDFDNENKGKMTINHHDQMKKLYDDLMKQIHEDKKHRLHPNKQLSEWDTIESYLSKNRQKVELYIRQNGRDLLSGDPIDINRLENYEIDHVLPRGFGDNSMGNLMLITREHNAKKSNRLPLQYIESGDCRDESGHIVTSKEYEQRIKELYELKLINELKRERCLLADTDSLEGFINRNLVDTRYIIKEFMSILRAYNQVNEFKTHIVALQSKYTKVYRRAFNMNKTRSLGDQHHAHDAAMLAIADHVLSNYYPNYDRRPNFKAYQKFMAQMSKRDRDEIMTTNHWVRIMYENTYHEYINDKDSLLAQIKSTVPLYSLKAEKNFKGAFFEATIYPQPKNIKRGDEKKVKKSTVLNILGVNNTKHIYSGIKCVAVDFYKLRDKKGKAKHVAIHIPRVIIDSDGNINKEKYIKLVRDYYKESDLIDEKGNIKTYYFRFRAFGNDIIYDTINKLPVKFAIGSIAKKLLEFNTIDIFNYESLYRDLYKNKLKIEEHFNMKQDNNSILFQKLNKEELIDFCFQEIVHINNYSVSRKYIINFFNSKDRMKNIFSFLENLSYVQLVMGTPFRSVDPEPRIRPSVNTFIKSTCKNENKNDAEYIKLKYSVLGIRFKSTENGLQIAGPNRAVNQYSKIRKEKFSWQICPEVIK
ncbi:type II CRISPR RNA-guided endonuclease Cas9 [Absicoccus porci]|uniref:type II CRISPR RNA-guided endonuclease Cas9 n=1 Tax=Absicoccus porci TaxID=2486576 RepID=UPI002A83C522|nr:type II CRISPR RNA-guided endonuclease Cas9 [Absicoccus porci]MDY4739241.1 type II CRISPR RNA-guided endonuclease Cas9 [Absicoccus porci]